MTEVNGHRDRITASADPDHLRCGNKYALISVVGPHTCEATKKRNVCNVAAFKIRGAYNNLDDAVKAATALQEEMSDADIYTVSMFEWTPLSHCGDPIPAYYDDPTLQQIMEEENKKRAGDLEKRLNSRTEFFDVIDPKKRITFLENRNKALEEEITTLRESIGATESEPLPAVTCETVPVI